jgi:hypothetical protein
MVAPKKSKSTSPIKSKAIRIAKYKIVKTLNGCNSGFCSIQVLIVLS